MVFKDAQFRGEKRALLLPVAADLEARVAKALASAPDFDASSITVTAVGDHIILKGFVSRMEESERAVLQARAIEGVTHVENQLRLR